LDINVELSLDNLKRFLFTAITFFSCLFSTAQFLELGGGGGVFNYSGDLIRGYRIGNVTPAVSIHHRQNFSNIVSVKYAFSAGYIKGTDSPPIDVFAEERSFEFRSTLFELSTVFEYNFLEYKKEGFPFRWTPYAFLGVAFTKWNDTDSEADFSRIQPSIPFGLGIKKLVGKRFSVDFEFGLRKTFFDYIDGISYDDLDRLKDYQYGNPSDNDWYYYSGISISYIIYKIPCPFPYRPNRYMFKR
jgi:hypothetical protein